MAKRRGDPKVEALRAERSLNPRPGEVRDPSFASSEFFDPRDLVQVKYEMVRQVRVDGQPVSRSAAGSPRSSLPAAFGMLRPGQRPLHRARMHSHPEPVGDRGGQFGPAGHGVTRPGLPGE